LLYATKSPEQQLIGRSPSIRTIDTDIDCAARSDAKVLITGETGVGKEVVARLIHQRSARQSAPLVTVN
jgi:transcriptional regulator with GAF, ATPase, and Fis domain